MQFNMNLPGLEDVKITKTEEINGSFYLYIEVPRKKHKCPVCGSEPTRYMITVLKRCNNLRCLKELPICFIESEDMYVHVESVF
ncbi:transposase [Pullulanibacillus pueri]|uniref:Zinc-finger of transposase IS204/IS1001/IS1096/IS1165 n=1 Tax=Pullulanibacillus pueri TaxID=1437324 RepID=A0A8J2ZTE1_9BACL|nr:transposase [Pullulanibacillus pueri]GGH75012.1 hypothetical protein GCM10007096_03790 [Pullulanibacillus pueri]